MSKLPSGMSTNTDNTAQPGPMSHNSDTTAPSVTDPVHHANGWGSDGTCWKCGQEWPCDSSAENYTCVAPDQTPEQRVAAALLAVHSWERDTAVSEARAILAADPTLAADLALAEKFQKHECNLYITFDVGNCPVCDFVYDAEATR